MTKQEIETPALLVDLDRMEANLERMAASFRSTPAKLRPHFKNHKCLALADRQLEAGAIGMTCATLREAESLVQHGIPSVLLANEVVDPVKFKQVVELARQADIIFCVDDEKAASDMARAGRNAGIQLSVLVDVDVGLHRCGAGPGEPAVGVVRAAVENGLRFRGLMGYEGHVSRDLPGPEKEQKAAAAMGLLMETKAHAERAGFPVEIVSAGATGTYLLSGRHPGVTEVQAGSYLLMDTNYRECCTDFDLALTVLATVVSRSEDYVVLDSGVKALSCERGIPVFKDREGLAIRKVNAEHVIVDLQAGTAPLHIGDKIEIWVRYSDATVNLYERMYGVRNGKVEEVFQLSTRGC